MSWQEYNRCTGHEAFYFMENQNPQDLNPNPNSSTVIPATSDAIPPPSLSVIPAKAGTQHSFPLILIVVLLVVVLGAGIYLGSSGKNFFSRDAGIVVPTPIVSAPTVQSTVDPTANWKTYSSKTFEFKYPNTWEMKTGESKENPDLITFTSDIQSSVSAGPVSPTPIRYSFYFEDLLIPQDKKPLEMLFYPFPVPQDMMGKINVMEETINSYIVYKSFNIPAMWGQFVVLFETLDKSKHVKFTFTPVNKELPLNNQEKALKLFDQILSTFKFTEKIQPSPTVTAINWELFTGETIYTTDGSSRFSIEYPENWLLESRNLFPNGKDGATLILGAGGHGLCEGCTEEELSQQYSFGEKQYTAGTAKTISNKVINETGNFVLASFEKGNVTYIFEFRNIPKANLDEYKATFEKMLTTFKFL